MTANPVTDPRPEPAPTADERTTLTGFLTWHRKTLELKCAGLSPADLARAAVPPSTLSLLGLVRHLAYVEHHWFRGMLAGDRVPAPFDSDEDPDHEFNGVKPTAEAVGEAWAAWRTAVDFADAFVAAAPDLDVTGKHHRRGDVSLRWVLVHMIEEYARHNGHADLLREQIDGATGE